MPADTVLDTIQRSMVLIGNASNYVSQVRRDNIIRKLESHNKGQTSAFKSIRKKLQPEEGLLFGSQVHKALNERAQTLDSFKKVALNVSQPQSTFRPSWKEKKFFETTQPVIMATGQAESSDHQTNNQINSETVAQTFTSRNSHQRPTTPNSKLSVPQSHILPACQTSTPFLTFPQHTDKVPQEVGGRLKFFTENWKQITHDPWVLQVISGCPLMFSKEPPLGYPHFSPHMHELTEDQQVIMAEPFNEVSDPSSPFQIGFPRILQQGLCRSQQGRRLASNHQLERSQPVFGSPS